jgi:type I restriction enzyme S subunit
MSEVELPEGWDEALMSDVTADVPSEDPARDPDRVFAYIDISAIDNRRFAITSDEVKEFRGRDAPSRARRPVRPADVLYSNIRTYLRNIALVEAGVPADLCSTGFTVLRSNGVIEPEYLFRWVLTEEFLELISPHETGTHYPATSDRAVRALPIRVPPLAEQRRIVEKVEALLAQVNAARARLAKVPTILKRFRQSILSAACSGRLSAGWDVDTVANASIQEEEIPEGWQWRELETLALPESSAICAGPFGTIFKAHDFRDEGVPIIFLRHVAPGEYRTAKPGFMDRKKWEDIFRPYSVWGGELLVAKLGDPPGCCAIYPKGIGPAMVTPDVIKMSVDERGACPQYLMYYLNSEPARQRAFGVAYGATRPRMNLDIFRALRVPLPPLPEQHHIVRRVDALFKLADAIEARVAAATARAEKITQAILAKAFRGELVPTEAELARQEGRDYEPASVLLARIRATHASPRPKPKRDQIARSR